MSSDSLVGLVLLVIVGNFRDLGLKARLSVTKTKRLGRELPVIFCAYVHRISNAITSEETMRAGRTQCAKKERATHGVAPTIAITEVC